MLNPPEVCDGIAKPRLPVKLQVKLHMIWLAGSVPASQLCYYQSVTTLVIFYLTNARDLVNVAFMLKYHPRSATASYHRRR